VDNLTEEQRKKNMRNIRSKGTKPERIIAKKLKEKEIYFTQHVKKVFGKPDITFLRKKVAVFIDSDFWHRHPENFQMPKTNRDYWEKKIERNVNRDKEVNKKLKEEGWEVIRIWESEIKNDPDNCVEVILKAIGRN
jgi:DNA mismatch endonuclease (patch repair protein)